jgi:uncharacterized protein (TIGR02217 family)
MPLASFAEVLFPVDISYGSQGGPEYSTSLVVLGSGREQRNQNWSVSRAKYDCIFGVRHQNDLDRVIQFFRARRGKLQGFLWKDHTDFRATAQVIGTGTGALLTFQLVKIYEPGSEQYSRTIEKPKADTVRIYLNSVLQTSGYTLTSTTGVVTFAVAPGLGVVVTANFEFYVKARFDLDQLPVSLAGLRAQSAPSIPIVEIR